MRSLFNVALHRKRLTLVCAGVVVTLAVLDQPRAVVAPETRAAHAAPVSAATSVVPSVALPPRKLLGPLRNDPFASRVETPKPPPPRAAEPETGTPTQVAPAVPYRYVGTVRYEGRLRVVLALGERIHIAAPGEGVDDVYLVAKVISDTVTLLYRPLGTYHELSLVADPNSPQHAVAVNSR